MLMEQVEMVVLVGQVEVLIQLYHLVLVQLDYLVLEEALVQMMGQVV